MEGIVNGLREGNQQYLKIVNRKVALKYFQLSVEVYLIHDDGSESLVKSEQELEDHYDQGGWIGVHVEDYLVNP